MNRGLVAVIVFWGWISASAAFALFGSPLVSFSIIGAPILLLAGTLLSWAIYDFAENCKF